MSIDIVGLKKSFGDVAVTDRSLIWNTDLIETLELDNLLGQAGAKRERIGAPPQDGLRARQQFTRRKRLDPCATAFSHSRVEPLADDGAALAR